MKKLIFVVALTLSACAPKASPTVIPQVPQAISASVDQDVRALSIKALSILQVSGGIVERAVTIEYQLRPALPAGWHEKFKDYVNPLIDKMLLAIDQIEKHSITTWAQFKTMVDPILGIVGGVVNLVRTLPQMTQQRSGFGGVLEFLGQTLSSLTTK